MQRLYVVILAGILAGDVLHAAGDAAEIALAYMKTNGCTDEICSNECIQGKGKVICNARNGVLTKLSDAGPVDVGAISPGIRPGKFDC